MCPGHSRCPSSSWTQHVPDDERHSHDPAYMSCQLHAPGVGRYLPLLHLHVRRTPQRTGGAAVCAATHRPHGEHPAIGGQMYSIAIQTQYMYCTFGASAFPGSAGYNKSYIFCLLMLRRIDGGKNCTESVLCYYSPERTLHCTLTLPPTLSVAGCCCQRQGPLPFCPPSVCCKSHEQSTPDNNHPYVQYGTRPGPIFRLSLA